MAKTVSEIVVSSIETNVTTMIDSLWEQQLLYISHTHLFPGCINECIGQFAANVAKEHFHIKNVTIIHA